MASTGVPIEQSQRPDDPLLQDSLPGAESLDDVSATLEDPRIDGAVYHDYHPDVPELASPLPASRGPTADPVGSSAAPQSNRSISLSTPPAGATTPLRSLSGASAPGSGPGVASLRAGPDDNLLGSAGLGQMGTLLWSQREESVVRNRQGSVLTRGLILKTDHFAGAARSAHLNLHLQGAPNFRKADCSLEVYGVAQPTITGLKTILSVLKARPSRDTPPSTTTTTTTTNSSSGATGSFPGWSPTASPNARPTQPAAETPMSRPSRPSRRCVWVCTREEPVIYVGGRPFVLREAERPLSTFGLSMRADNLEAIELRLKQDILREAAKYGGLLMVHEETASGDMSPTWIAVDSDSVYTVRQVWDRVKQEGWSVDYHRIPIAEDQAIENNYLDAYTQVIKDLDPTQTSLVANCGVGFTRTTFAMVAAVILRRKQMLLNGHPDPFAGLLQRQEAAAAASSTRSPSGAGAGGGGGGASTPNSSVAKSIRQATEQHAHNRTLLRLIRVLNESLSTKDSQSTIEILLSQPALLEALRKANSGDYGVIRQLSGLLDEGLESKAVVDAAVDSCAHVTNLRETILHSRIKYSTDALDADQSTYHLEKAAKSLEKYFFLVAFASYVNASKTATFQHRFASWLKNRVEIWRGITMIRSKGRKLYFFDPVSDLSVISRGAAGDLKASSRKLQGRFGEVSGQGAQVPGDEFAEYVIRNRAGVVLRPFTLLKCDIWRKFIERNAGLPVRGTVNFRRIPGSNIFATGQPTVEGIRNVVAQLQEYYQPPPQQQQQHSYLDGEDAAAAMAPDAYPPTTVTWINLREEPLVYVNGKPYCLRQKGMSLRNIKAYSGINWDRLLLLEDRLKNDVLNELEAGEGRLLLHTETADGTVVPIWEEAAPHDVDTIQGVMALAEREWRDKVQLRFRRIPMTAEKPPDFSDISELLSVVLKANIDRSPIVLNCQLGRGRSTMTAVLILMIARWLDQHKPVYDEPDAVLGGHAFPTTDRGAAAAPLRSIDGGSDGASTPLGGGGGGRAVSTSIFDPPPSDEAVNPRREPLSYHVINSLLRVIPKGLEVKRIVDSCIDQCSGVTNLRDAIEDSRLAAEDTEDEAQRRKHIQSAIHNLRRYFELIIFQSYLSQTRPTSLQSQSSFRAFVIRQPVFTTIAKDFEKIDISTIMPLQKVDASDGVALSDEVQDVVSHRSGSILSAYTMLKSDFFSGILKLGLPEQIDGMPNLRGVPLLLTPHHGLTASAVTPSGTPRTPFYAHGRETWGSGMPTVEGLRRGLSRMGAAPNGPNAVVWTSLREEPVLYVNGRPHVLRLADQPVTNIEATGITTEVVEGMELSLKHDMLEEARQRNGRVLLHDEVEISQGEFDIIPVWETVKEGDVLTPREVYELVQREGFKVDYARLAITDEQAPVPAVFSQLEARVIKALQTGSACVFNCQMGRGRTTTGMVIASLVSTVWHYGDEMVTGNDMGGSAMLGGGGIEEPDFGNPKDALDNREDDLWLQGEWRTILQLVGVLSHGKLAKKLTDRAIDRMEAVQNLRKAIYDSKLRADNAEVGTKKQKHLHTVFVNYLQRYGYLITFANYLLEKSDACAFEPLSAASSLGGGPTDDDEHSFFSSVAGGRKRSESMSSNVSTSTSMTGSSFLVAPLATTSGATVAKHQQQQQQQQQDDGSRRFPTFLGWLQPRREIFSILGRTNLE
ncbi:uncharacterized protein PFL1_06237 [Pseudozyma flocculosa PF-1]|uniref:Inositol hexakisphosphate-domain-containing protein n=2 Tax=Pseudozyma flocculosa TaxID=84751 RepID=A0A5C3F7A1_9BASI|nr:uncharacterized protein PFL1_06237 [Pseudozyma flocculosa PF-1]EPQ26302.1 hypothetical protein PFL1_06237 [Pseudozyma flocculosa PF-1]SPO40262.1 uncharacterized protein PSFLO_05744 [Pseudozyma flocculosa]